MESKKNNVVGILVGLGILIVLGFFIYPKISHQKGDDPVAPEQPQNLNAESSQDSINLSWDAPRSDGGSEIDFYVARYIYDRNEPVDQNVGVSLSHTFNQLQDGTYDVYVAASNSAGLGDFAGPISVKVSNRVVQIDAPSSFNVTTGNTSVTLDWLDPEGDFRLSNYHIGYRTENEEEYTFITSVTKPYTFDELTNGTEYLFVVYLETDLGNSDTSEPQSGTPGDSSELDFSNSPNVSVNNNSATITWGTSKSASSQVYYGPTVNLGRSSEVMNTTPMVTGHTVVLSNLNSCTAYLYKVASYDALENFLESSVGEFVTSGCMGGASATGFDAKRVTQNDGAVVQIDNLGRRIQAVAPPALVTGQNVAIQAIKVTKEDVINEINKPASRVWVGDSYVLNAIDDSNAYVNSFDKNVSISIDYLRSELGDVDEDSLKIWHHDSVAGWRELSSCQIVKNQNGGTVTCQTDSFSVFGLFGSEGESGGGDSDDQSSSNQSQGGSSGVTGYNPNVVNSPIVANNTTPAQSDIQNIQTTTEIKNSKFLVNLWYGLKHPEVRMLQVFLNKSGFVVSEEGAGSEGEETDFFGNKTRSALIKFQEQYKDTILLPLGLNFGTGFFGPQTRNFINSL